jgi:hypothetical protein
VRDDEKINFLISPGSIVLKDVSSSAISALLSTLVSTEDSSAGSTTPKLVLDDSNFVDFAAKVLVTVVDDVWTLDEDEYEAAPPVSNFGTITASFVTVDLVLVVLASPERLVERPGRP